MLAESISSRAISITQEEDKFILRSEACDNLDNAQEVSVKAKDMLTALSGAVRLTLGGRTSMAIGNVYRIRDNGSRDHFIMAEPVQINLRVLPPTLSMVHRDGTQEIHRPADQAGSLSILAGNDHNVAKALRLRDCDDLRWIELYRIYEVVDSDVGRSKITSNGWASDSDIKRFKHTANSVAATGDQARHGKEMGQPPANPMTLSRAQEFIDTILNRWLEYKLSKV